VSPIKRIFSVLGILACIAVGSAYAGDTVKLSGTRFEMEVPKDWQPGYKDLDDKLLMVYFKDAKTGMTLEGVYLRKVQPVTYSLADFKKWRIEAEGKRYDGKEHTVVKEETLSIGGMDGNYLLTSWKDGGKEFEKHTAQYLKDGRQYMVVLHGAKGKVDKGVFDQAVSSFALGKE
jgi:hypothetical protein